MSKKSTPARSNYKAPVKNPVDPKKATMKTIIGAVALLVVVVVVIVVASAFTREGISSAEDNWVVERVRYNNGYVYYKVGEVADIEGFVLDPEASISLVGELDRTVAYSPIAEDSAIDQIVFYPSPYSYDVAAESGMASLTAVETDMTASEIITGQSGDKNYTYFTYTLTPEAAEGETAAMSQWLVAYVELDEDTSIMITVNNNTESEADFVEDALLMETFEKALAALTITD